MNLARDLRLALDACAFARSLGIDPDPWQAEVLDSTSRRILLNCSRQSGKSTVSSILGLHRALYYPGSLILIVSPSLRQSGELFRKVQDLTHAMPERPRLTEDSRLSFQLDNGSRLISLPASESTVRGFSSADLIIEDESARVPDDLHDAMRPMLAVSGGRMILLSTPWGKRGHFFEAWQNGGDAWERVEVPAPACPRIAPAFLEDERAAIGEWVFSQEYLCHFRETEDACFTYDQISKAITEDVKPLWSPP